MHNDENAAAAAAGRPVLLAAVLCAGIVGGVPLFFLFYFVLGSALLGAVVLGVLILVQTCLFLPFWIRLSNSRDAATQSSDGPVP